MDRTELGNKLSEKNLRITPQRIAILGAVMELNNHPTADQINDYIKAKHPNIAVGTVYKVLDSFVDKKILKKVKTENGIMRFDPLIKNHHHLFCKETDRIEDFEDDDLDQLISQYLKKKGFKNFKVQDFNLHITGIFK